MAATSDRYFWILHLSAAAPRCNVPQDHPYRSRMATLSLEGGSKALLTRLEVAAADVRWELDRADPTLVRISDKVPLAYVWAGPEIADLQTQLAVLRTTGWAPANLSARAAA